MRLFDARSGSLEHVLKGQRPVTAELALRLGLALRQTPQYWLNLQAAYDLKVAQLALKDSLLAVRAQPGARKNAVLGEQAGALKVSVTAPPEDGRANAAITELLREWLGLKRAQVDLRTGYTNTFSMTPDELKLLIFGGMRRE